jgi:hypothetical protein
MKKIVVIILGVCVLFSGTVFAQDLYKTHTFSFGLETFYIENEEDTNLPTDPKWDGVMYGGYLDYDFHGNNSLMLGADLSVTYGKLDFESTEVSTNRKVTSDSDNWIVEIRGLIGYDWGVGSGSILTPFTGFGYRYWNDDDSAGYEREVTYYYSPIGLMFAAPMNSNWNWGINAEYDFFWGGTAKAYFSDVDSGLNDPEGDWGVGDGYGVRGSIWFAGDVSNNMGMRIEPFVRYWDIDDSDTDTVTLNGTPIAEAFEPATTVFAAGVRVGLEF